MKTQFSTLCLFLVFLLKVNAQVPSGCGSTNWPADISSSAVNFSVPAGTGTGWNYRWVVSNPAILVIVSGQTSSTASIKGLANGTATVFVTKYKDGVLACSDMKIITVSGIDGGGSGIPCNILNGIQAIYEPCETLHVDACSIDGAQSYKWFVNGELFTGGGLFEPDPSTGNLYIELGFLLAGTPNYNHLLNTTITITLNGYDSNNRLVGSRSVMKKVLCTINGGAGLLRSSNMGSDEIFLNELTKSSNEKISGIDIFDINGIRLTDFEVDNNRIVLNRLTNSILIIKISYVSGRSITKKIVVDKMN